MFTVFIRMLRKRMRLIICLLLLLCACQGQEKESVLPAVEEQEEIFIPYSKPKPILIQDVFEEYHYVRLETTSSALLPAIEEITAVHMGEDGVIYVSDTKKLFLFEPNGSLRNVISHQGDGPESYLSIISFTVWPNQDITISQYGNDLISYTSTGKFISKLHFNNWMIKDLISLNDRLLLLEMDPIYKDSTLYNLVDRNTGKILSRYFPLRQVNKERYFMLTQFYKYNGKILRSGYQSNRIYALSEDTAVIHHPINVDNRMPPEDFWRQKDKNVSQIRQEWEHSGYIGHIPYYVESDSLIFLRYEGHTKELQACAVIEKVSGRSCIVNRLVFDDFFNSEPKILWPQQNGWCIIPLYPHEILGNPKFAKSFPGLKEEDNPKFFIGKVK